MSEKESTIDTVTGKILVIRGKRVMLDRDLAKLYGIKAIALRQQVKRNKERFPKDFMFRLNLKEAGILVSHFVIPMIFEAIKKLIEPPDEPQNQGSG